MFYVKHSDESPILEKHCKNQNVMLHMKYLSHVVAKRSALLLYILSLDPIEHLSLHPMLYLLTTQHQLNHFKNGTLWIILK